MEILTAQVKTDESHAFTFSKPVKQFMVGFSQLDLGYNRPDHHVKQITIDLTDSKLSGNQVIVKPILRMTDNAGHKQSSNSFATIVVISTFSEGDSNSIQLFSGVKGHFKNRLSIENPTFVRSCLTYSSIGFSSGDHHMMKYNATVNTLAKNDSFIIRGQSIFCDRHPEHKLEDGKIFGSSIVSYDSNQKVIFADFSSQNIGESGNVCFGDAVQGLNYNDYDIGIFIDTIDVSFKNNTDHHVLKFELSAELCEPKLFVSDGKVNAKVNLKSYLTDNGENQYNIPHNTIAGFLIAFDKK